MTIALIDTIPADARNQGTINLGYEIVATKTNADRYHWRDIPDKKYDEYYFNIYYPVHIFNMNAFLRNNNIPILKNDRMGIKVVVGGQGVSNLNGCLDNIVDEIFVGEYDYDTELKGWHRSSEVSSPPVLKENLSLIELTRGCKYRCAFCEYGWVQGGRFREKDITQVKREIEDSVARRGKKKINFLSANLGSYSKLDELIDYCNGNGIRVLNGEACLKDIGAVKKHLQQSKAIRVGLESFSEVTRAAINKPFTDAEFENFAKWGANHMSALHFYLIYGLPNDDYNAWYKWLGVLGKIRKSITDKPLRMEFNITNFEPCIGTPLQDAKWVDFEEKNYFLKHWTAGLFEHGFRMGNSEITYANGRGRLGRKQQSYLTLMYLKTRGVEITNAIVNSFSNGATRSLDDKKCENFIRLCEKA